MGLLRHLCGNLREFGAHGGGQIEHLDPLRLNSELFKGVLNVLYFFSRAYISFQEMTFAFQSPGHIDGVRTALDGPQQVHDINPPAARYLDHLYIGRIV